MNVILYADNTLSIAVAPMCELLNSACSTVRFSAGAQRLHIDSPFISCPSTYQDLPGPVLEECGEYDIALMASSIPYDNNYFYEWDGPKAIISFSGWNGLTDLPITNGLVYFIAAILSGRLGCLGSQPSRGWRRSGTV